MSVSGQVSVTGPPHRRTRDPEPRAPALNSADARLRERPPGRADPRAAPSGIPVARGPRRPAAAGHRCGTGARGPGARTGRVRGSTGSGGHGSPVDSSSPARAPFTELLRERLRTRGDAPRGSSGAGAGHDRGNAERGNVFRAFGEEVGAVLPKALAPETGGVRTPSTRRTGDYLPLTRMHIKSHDSGTKERVGTEGAGPRGPAPGFGPVPRTRRPYPAASRPPCISDRMMWLSR